MKRPNLEAMDEDAARFDSNLSSVISWALNREARVKDLEGELKTSCMKSINLRLELDYEKTGRENVERCLRETQKLRLEDVVRVKDLEATNADLNEIINQGDAVQAGARVELEVKVAELEHTLADAMEQLDAIQGTSQVHIDRVRDLEGQLKKCAVHTRQELNLGSGDPADYEYTRHCSLCHKWSEKSDDADVLKPVVHAASCLLLEPIHSKSVSSSTEEIV